ncbi:MAG: AMP-binding protein [Acidobacteria bacterium]|nr:AMP-binding protein [Acidobacteriota bacterium]
MPKGNEVIYHRSSIETATASAIRRLQARKFDEQARRILSSNKFYQRKFASAGLRPEQVKYRNFAAFPFTLKSELVQDQLEHPPFGTNLTVNPSRFIRMHQTSATTGKPLKWLDTRACWRWWMECWAYIYRGVGVRADDKVFVAFSFGPFIGFWTAFEGAQKLGNLVLAGGGQSSEQRVLSILENKATVLVCTPTYALRLGEVAGQMGGVDLRQSSVRLTINAGEPGASIPATKQRIEELWGAKCYDHPGMTEVGAYGFECALQTGGVHLNEGEFIFEVVEPATGRPVGDGEQGELVISNLGRIGMPLIRYRTGDRVRLNSDKCACGRTFRRAMGGVLGRVDDMITVRGVNVFPSGVENVLRGFPEIEEFEIEVFKERHMDELVIRIELKAGLSPDADPLAALVQNKVRAQLGIRARVSIAEKGSLPRYELKARRIKVRAAGV